MATSCIYFVLVLTILSLRNTSAAFHDNDNITRNHNFNNINSTNTNNNINYNNTNINNNKYNNNNNIESATQHYSAGILPYNESSASELSSTNKNNNNNYNYSIYQAEKERYKEYPDTDSTLIITETDSEASNTQKNKKSKKKKQKKEEDNNNVIIQTERQHFGDTDIFGAYSLPDDPIYTNEFAVHIPAGKYVADGIADKYGFINRGQVIIGIDKCDNKANNKKKKTNAPCDEQSLVST